MCNGVCRPVYFFKRQCSTGTSNKQENPTIRDLFNKWEQIKRHIYDPTMEL